MKQVYEQIQDLKPYIIQNLFCIYTVTATPIHLEFNCQIAELQYEVTVFSQGVVENMMEFQNILGKLFK
jgi:hypothetical protein